MPVSPAWCPAVEPQPVETAVRVVRRQLPTVLLLDLSTLHTRRGPAVHDRSPPRHTARPSSPSVAAGRGGVQRFPSCGPPGRRPAQAARRPCRRQPHRAAPCLVTQPCRGSGPVGAALRESCEQSSDRDACARSVDCSGVEPTPQAAQASRPRRVKRCQQVRRTRRARPTSPSSDCCPVWPRLPGGSSAAPSVQRCRGSRVQPAPQQQSRCPGDRTRAKSVCQRPAH